MSNRLLAAAILSGLSMSAVAESAYWIGTDGDYVRDRNGHCVRTINWTSEDLIAGCEGGESAASAVASDSKTTADQSGKDGDAASNAGGSGDTAAVAATGAAGTAAVITGDDDETVISLSSGTTFELGGSELSAEGKAEIAALVAQYEGKTAESVVIEGHTDSSGDEAFNKQLSEKRAEAVKAELVANGANPDKITTVGYGESKPIADNSTREGRAKNRRVEIRVEGIKDKV